MLHAMRAHQGMDVQLPSISTLVPDRGERSALHSVHFDHVEEPPDPIKQDAVWTPATVWMLWGENLSSLPGN